MPRSDAEDTPVQELTTEEFVAAVAPEAVEPPDKFPLEPQPMNFRWGLYAALALGVLLFAWGVYAAFLTIYYDVPAGHVAVITAPDGVQTVTKENGATSRRNKVTIVDLRVNVVKVTKTVPSKDNNAWNVELTVPWNISSKNGAEAGAKAFIFIYKDKQWYETQLRAYLNDLIVSVTKTVRDKDMIDRDLVTKKFNDTLKEREVAEAKDGMVVIQFGPIGYNAAKLHAPDKSSDSQILIVPPGASVNIDTGAVRKRVREKPQTLRRHRVTSSKTRAAPRRRAPRRSQAYVWTCGPFGIPC